MEQGGKWKCIKRCSRSLIDSKHRCAGSKYWLSSYRWWTGTVLRFKSSSSLMNLDFSTCFSQNYFKTFKVFIIDKNQISKLNSKSADQAMKLHVKITSFFCILTHFILFCAKIGSFSCKKMRKFLHGISWLDLQIPSLTLKICFCQ